MSTHRAFVGTLTIPISTAVSNILANKQLKLARALLFENEETTFTGNVAVESAAQEAAVAGDMYPVAINGGAVVLTAGAREQFNVTPGVAIRLNSDANEAAERVVKVYALIDFT